MARIESRLIRCVLLSLCMGAATTVAVAWTIAAFGAFPMERGRDLHGFNELFMKRIIERNAIGARSTSIGQQLPAGMARGASGVGLSLGQTMEMTATPVWLAHYKNEAQAEDAPYRTWNFEERGWPMLCLWYQHRIDPKWANPEFPILSPRTGFVESVYGGLRLTRTPAVENETRLERKVRALPLKPIWPGLLGNTVLFAVLWGVGFSMWRSLYPALDRGAMVRLGTASIVIATGVSVLIPLGSVVLPLPESATFSSGVDRDRLYVRRLDGMAFTRIAYQRAAFRANWTDAPLHAIDVLPLWSRDVLSRAPAEDGGYQSRIHVREARGWPFRSLSSSFSVLGGEVDLVRGFAAKSPPAPPAELPFSYRVLPTQPYWPGLLGNIAVLGALIFPLLSLPQSLIRSRRRRRGWCLQCGYDLRGSKGCPECGWLR